ncbi:MAG: macro domain-containing protein [Bacteroidota bacterium]
MNSFSLILVDPNPMLCQEWENAFQEFDSVEVVNDYFEKLPVFDCMVSAANSFGLMDGGVDLAIINFFGPQLEREVQAHILSRYWGEQSVGTSFIFPTAHPKHPYLAHTPTMRVPSNISHSDNVYLAMKAMLEAVHHHNEQSATPINTLACPGLGTSTGRVPYPKAARDMAMAYRNYLNPPSRIDWNYATYRQHEVKYGKKPFQ